MIILSLFLAAAALLWLSTYGYLGSLAWAARFGARHRSPATRQPGPDAAGGPCADEPTRALPDIAVVVPVRDEEHLILQKLGDLRRTDYPGRITWAVADGGSTDGTVGLVEREIARGEPIRLIRTVPPCGKSEQINAALGLLTEDFVVFTDADSVLDRACIGELVRLLMDDPQTALAGAVVLPRTELLEERIHWWLVNNLWWLEGEVLSAGVVGAPCYAVRRRVVRPLVRDAVPDDVHLALALSARGHRVRLCRTAHATELRVPRTRAEALAFRRRRGAEYLRELRRSTPGRRAPAGSRIAWLARCWHFRVTPALGVVVAATAVTLSLTRHWPWPWLVVAAFLVPAVVALAGSKTLRTADVSLSSLVLAAGRLAWMLWYSLVTLDRPKTGPHALGGPP